MKYRKLAGEDVSVLGFGCMRFPLMEGSKDAKDIDIEKSEEILKYAADNGVNYFDTAYVYHSGISENFLGNFLEKNSLRNKIKIATKCPVWLLKEASDFERILDEQLERLKTDYIDFYLLHALDREEFEERVVKFNLAQKMSEAKKSGKIKHIGFSFHDDLDTFKMIVDSTPEWEFCQIQLNYINTEYQAGIEGLEYAHSKGLDVIIMEPLLGGKLACPSPQVLEKLSPEKTPAQWGFDFLWNRPEVSITLSGMGAMEQVKENIKSADNAEIGMLSDDDIKMFKEAKDVFDRMALVPCTKCAYCMPCPFGLDIPKTFEAYNMTASAGMNTAKEVYNTIETKADKCRKCKKCEVLCPQNIKISEVMSKINEVFK